MKAGTSRRPYGLIFLGALLAAALLVAQEGSKPAPAQPPEKEKQEKKEAKPRRTFTGKITLRSSRQESDTASYGFKGVGEDGGVQQATLNAQPGGEDHQKVARLASYQVPGEELQAFIHQGGLRAPGTPAKEKKNP